MDTVKTITLLETIPDAIGKPLTIDDFVTAVFKDGELTLFKVVRFEHKEERYIDPKYAHIICLSDLVVLQRVQGTNAYLNPKDHSRADKFNKVLVRKTGKQVAWADPNTVLMHFFSL